VKDTYIITIKVTTLVDDPEDEISLQNFLIIIIIIISNFFIKQNILYLKLQIASFILWFFSGRIPRLRVFYVIRVFSTSPSFLII